MLASADLKQDGLRGVWIGEVPVLLGRVESGCFAMLNRCSHAGSPLDGGRIRRNRVICPLHGAQFDVSTGSSRADPPCPALPIFAVRERDGMIEVSLPSEFQFRELQFSS